jgi:adenosylhomocysteine nucleosidase
MKIDISSFLLSPLHPWFMGPGWFLQNWFRLMAGQTLRRTVAEAARQRVTAAIDQSAHPAEGPRECDAGIVFALTSESGGLEDLLEGVVRTRAAGFAVRQGQWHGRHVVLVISGAGRQAALRATDALILGHRPRWVISAGFCGGLSPEVRRHDIVIADKVTSPGGQVGMASSSWPCSSHAHEDVGMAPTVDLDAARLDPAVLVPPPRVHVGRLLTVGGIVRQSSQKRELGERHQALAVDLESFAVAQTCRRQGVPCLAIRVVSDALEDELPREVERLVRQKTHAARWGAALGAMLNRPGVVKDLYKLKEDALAASDCLGRFLTRVIERL